MQGNYVAVFMRLILHKKAVSLCPRAQSAIGNQVDSNHEDFCLLKEGMLVYSSTLGWAGPRASCSQLQLLISSLLPQNEQRLLPQGTAISSALPYTKRNTAGLWADCCLTTIASPASWSQWR